MPSQGLACTLFRSFILSAAPPAQGLPVRELLQLQFKIVRDKSIKEAMLFGLYFAVFLLVAFQVWAK
jgi:hypothetical protein